MFERTRWKLTLLYSSTMVIILMFMIILIYVILFQALQRNEQTDLKVLVDKGVHEWTHDIDETDQNHPNAINKETKPYHFNWEFVPSNQFLILFDKNNQVTATSKQQQNITAAAKDWLLLKEKGQEKSRLIQLNKDTDNGKVYALYEQEVSFPLLDFQGRMVVGQDVSSDWHLLQQMKIMLGIIGGFLFFVATAAGYIFSGRAMVPIRKAYRRQQDFVTDASHELRTPLSVLQSSVEVLDEVKEKIPSFHQEVLSSMKGEIERMIQMAGFLLDLARSDAGHMKIMMEPFDLAKEIKNVVDRLKALAIQKEIYLQASTIPATYSYVGDALRIQQMLYIIIDNAIKYTHEKGTVEVEFMSVAEHEVIIKVKDNGMGIPEEDLPQIFERFYRVDKARSRESYGNGLGLSIAKYIVDAHGGYLSVMSQVGQGSVFQIHLPYYKNKEQK